jgi:hypothetical protein
VNGDLFEILSSDLGQQKRSAQFHTPRGASSAKSLRPAVSPCGAADASEPVHETLDALCAQLWGVDAAGLRAIQSAYRDLYVTAPKEQNPGDAALYEEPGQ